MEFGAGTKKNIGAHTKKGGRAQPHKTIFNGHRTETRAKEREEVFVLVVSPLHLSTDNVELQDSYMCGI
jgi:hypothetical protein